PQGHMNGSVFAKSWSGTMELHHVPFVGDLSIIANNPPVIVSEAVTATLENETYNYQVVAEDEDIPLGDVLSYSLDLSPAGAVIDAQTGLIDWLPTEEYVASVSEFNSQCYVVPAGSVGVLQEDVIGTGPTYIAPLFQEVKQALESAGAYTSDAAYSWHQTNQ